MEDPHNLGSILRTADATGVHGIIIPKRRSASLTATVAKASTGAIEHVPVVRVTNLTQTIEQLKARGVWVFGTDMSGTDYRKWNTSGPLAIVMGNEGKGRVSYREGKRGRNGDHSNGRTCPKFKRERGECLNDVRSLP